MNLDSLNFNLPALLGIIHEPTAVAMPLASGASCHVWCITGGQQSYVLRVFSKRAARCPLHMDIAIRSQLSAIHAAVAKPIVSWIDQPQICPDTEWNVDKFVSGIFLTRGEISKAVSKDLGRVLAALHALPTKGFGTPITMESQTFAGRETSALAGLNNRFENPLPTDDNERATHPIFQNFPEFTDRLEPAIARIHTELSRSKAVLCHTDLHERQFICCDGRLAALIDFADATIADPRWDFASLYYFHGRKILENVLLGYTEEACPRQLLTEGAILFSIGIAMHHASRSQYPGKEHRLTVATNHLNKTLGSIAQ